VRGAGVLAAALAAALVLAIGGSAAPQLARAGIYTGYAFDACNAPSSATLAAWTASPYRALGIYIGGVNRACANTNLGPDWVAGTLTSGWSLLPLYVGLQAPCVTQSGLARISSSTTTAATEGQAAADDAINRAGILALPAGSPIYFDMEGYSLTNLACTASVQAFVRAWVNELRASGYVAGVYGSAASTIRDVALLGTSIPDAVWIADWNGVESVFGDPYVPDSLWPNHQRVHQYKGGHNETYGTVTINVDSNVVDGPVVGGGAPPPPTTPPPPPPAGSVGSGDGRALASWPDGAFPTAVVVTLTPVAPPAQGGYAVQLTVTDPSSSQPVTSFGAPMTVLITNASGLVPVSSPDGTTWAPLPQSAYTFTVDGGVVITTTVPGFLGLVPDSVPPSQTAGFQGRFVNGSLRISWSAATDVGVGVGSYEVLLDGTLLKTVPATTRRAIVRAFHPAAQTVYRVRAVDAAGNSGKPSKPLVVLPTRRPAAVPRPLPAWAWTLYDSQHGNGARPAAAPRPLPQWYWQWAGWRAAPFHLKRPIA